MDTGLALQFLLPIGVSFGVSFLTTWWVVKFGDRLKILDNPALHRQPKVVHSTVVPRGGGIPIFAALVTGLVMFVGMGDKRVIGIIAGAAVLAVTGFLDDRFEEKVSPYLRLALNILAALMVIGAGIGIAYITNPWGGVIRLDQPQYCFVAFGTQHCVWILSSIFGLVLLVWMQNIVGWSSGVDGQLSGFVITAAITMGLLGLRFGLDNQVFLVILLAAITAGAYLGFLPWNWWPQKIMPGYGGKSLAGYLLGILAIMSFAKVGTLLMVLGIPFIDALLVIIKRIREGRSPVWGGREHLHHYLLDLGWSKQRIAITYWLASILMAWVAWQLQPRAKFYTMAAVGLILGGLILWLQYWSISSKQPDRDSG
jgi:UDP-GlcNAc:undecaprenyl-phosphate/decaprenyl-phosphate GlcNAc-1-phosphate transferase